MRQFPRKASVVAVAAGLATALPLLTGAASSMAASVPKPTSTAMTSLNAPAVQLRVTLDRLLGAHAFLALRAMDQGYSGSPDFPATAAALTANTDALTEAIASVYGWRAAATFRKVWTAHIGDFVNYVVATKSGNKAGQERALAGLNGYVTASSQFFSSLDPQLSATVLASGLKAHIQELIQAFQDYAHGRYEASASATVTAYDHMFMMGDYLSEGIAAQNPKTFSGNAVSSAANLEVALDQLLGAHAFLALNAMEQGYAGAANYNGTVAALNQNTQNLAAAIASVYGPQAGAEFAKIWTKHIDLFVQFVGAWKSGDKASLRSALSGLAGYKTQFAQFLASANPEVNPTAVSAALQVHIHELTSTFDAYRLNQYAKAATGQVYAYDHMFMTGGYLATVISEQYPGKFGA